MLETEAGHAEVTPRGHLVQHLVDCLGNNVLLAGSG